MVKKVLISTGGSGGHVIPAITIYNHLKNTHEILISSDIRGLSYLDKNYNTVVINTPKLNNYFLFPFSFFNSFFFLLDLKLSQLILMYLLLKNHHNLKKVMSFQLLGIILY